MDQTTKKAKECFLDTFSSIWENEQDRINEFAHFIEMPPEYVKKATLIYINKVI